MLVTVQPNDRLERCLNRLAKRASDGLRRQRFRGEIYDYARNIWLGSGYLLPETNVCRNCRSVGKTHCRHFEIDTCRQLIGPFKALLDPNVDTVMLLKAVQTLGSLAWDLMAHFVIVHSPFMRIKIFIDNEEKARKYSDDRWMMPFKANPDIARFLPSGLMRHFSGKKEVHFTNGKSIIICGLNESNASSLSADLVVIDEGWEHGSDGLMQKAIDRTKQARATGNCKVFIVGQAGNVREDQDVIWNRLHKRVPITWACPCCGKRQGFGEQGPAIQRPAEFKAIPVPQVAVPPAPGSWAGLKTPKPFSELITPKEIKSAAASAWLECLFCGYEIRDTPAMRNALMASYNQEYREQGPAGLYTPEHFTVGFWNPDPVSVTIPFAETMHEYIVAKKTDAEMGGIQKLQDFYQNRWATAWDEASRKRPRMEISVGTYETEPDKLTYSLNTMRQMTVDCGKSPDSETNVIQIGMLFFEIRDFDNGAESLARGSSRQLARGMVQDCIMDAPEGRRLVSCWELLAAQQHYWKITNRHVLIDLGYAPSQVIEAAVKHHEIVDLKGNPVARENYGKQVDWASCWRGCQGSADSRIGPAKKVFYESAIPGLQSTHDKSGRLRKISLSRIQWSNYAFEDQFERIVLLKTGAVAWEILAQDKLVIVGLDGKPNKELTERYIEFEQDNEGSRQFRSWMSGLNSRTLDETKHKYVDNWKRAFAEGHWTEPRDVSLLQILGAACEGLLGHVSSND